MKWTPQCESELVDAVRAARSDLRTFEIIGHGTKRRLGRPIEASTMLDLSALTGIVRYDPDELVVTARGATPIDEIQDAISPRNQCLGFEPVDWSALFGEGRNGATIGGTIAADACGSRRVRYGAVRDHLLGYAGVNGFAELYRAGGRVVKNVTGFDLPKSVCGAMGTLGILTEVTLRLMPKPPDCAILMVRNVDAETGLALLRRLWSSALDATGLAYVPAVAVAAFPEFGEVGNGVALVRLEGPSLEEKTEAADLFLRPHEVIRHASDPFARIGSGATFAHRPNPIWRIFVPPASAAACADGLGSRFWVADWAGGAIWVEGGAPDVIRPLAQNCGGYAQLFRADDAMWRHSDMFAHASPANRALTLRVKQAFDPLGLFNPGRIFSGI